MWSRPSMAEIRLRNCQVPMLLRTCGIWRHTSEQSLIRKEIPRERFRVVLNRHQKRALIGDSEIEKTIGQKIDWKVPNQYAHVVKAINGGDPVAQLSSSDVTKNLRDLASHLGAKPAPGEKKKESSGFLGLLGRS